MRRWEFLDHMGCTQSVSLPEEAVHVEELSRELGYSPSDIRDMHDVFSKMDIMGTGSVTFDQFCKFNGITSEFEKKFVHLFEANGFDTIDFHNYLLLCWNLLSFFDRKAVSALTFNIFDKNNFGEISHRDVMNMIDVVWEGGSKTNPCIIEVFIKEQKDWITRAEFVDLVQQSPILLQPLWYMQEKLQRNTLGMNRWRMLSKRHKRKRQGSIACDRDGNVSLYIAQNENGESPANSQRRESTFVSGKSPVNNSFKNRIATMKPLKPKLSMRGAQAGDRRKSKMVAKNMSEERVKNMTKLYSPDDAGTASPGGKGHPEKSEDADPSPRGSSSPMGSDSNNNSNDKANNSDGNGNKKSEALNTAGFSPSGYSSAAANRRREVMSDFETNQEKKEPEALIKFKPTLLNQRLPSLDENKEGFGVIEQSKEPSEGNLSARSRSSAKRIAPYSPPKPAHKAYVESAEPAVQAKPPASYRLNAVF